MHAILALRYRVPVHGAICDRRREGYRIRFTPAMDFSGLGRNPEDIFEATLRMNRLVEGWIRESPEQWLWIHDRWKNDR